MNADIRKNYENAYLADKLKIGDKVKVIKTERIGTVSGKTKYDRENSLWNSPYGYTTIQVTFPDCTRSYSARSLKKITKC